MAAFFTDPTLLLFLRSIPLGRMASFPGSPLTPADRGAGRRAAVTSPAATRPRAPGQTAGKTAAR